MAIQIIIRAPREPLEPEQCERIRHATAGLADVLADLGIPKQETEIRTDRAFGKTS